MATTTTTHGDEMTTDMDVAPPNDHSHNEGFLHYLAREGRVALWWAMALSVIGIVICMVTLWFLAVIPAVVLLTSYILLVLANEVERRSDPAAHAALEMHETAYGGDVVEDHAEDHQLAPADAALVKRESKTGVAIVASVLVAALLIAGILLPWKVVAIGAFVVFAYMLLVAAPLWLGWIEDDIELHSTHVEQAQKPA